jgi:DNA polymerase-3 subunit delta
VRRSCRPSRRCSLSRSAGALHVASEPLSARDQVAAVLELGRAEGLRISPTLGERIAEEAGGDLMLARLELQKFALYADASPERPQDLDEQVVDALGIDQSETDQGRPGDLALAGDLAGLSAELALLDGAGIDPIPVVRALQRRLLMLAPLRARIEGGQRADAVLASVWKRDKAAVQRILPRWTAPRLAEVFARVQKLERDLMLRPLPGSAALGETLLQIARAAQR